MDYAGKVGFAVGTGRCGTLFLYQLLGNEPDVASSHERNPENEAFHRYCKWHGLAVDDEGFLSTKEREIRADLEQKAFSFEATPYLSLSLKELHERFGAKFLLVVRRPDRVVTSFVHKGFYRKPYVVGNPGLAAGYQDQSPERFFTFFARISPRGDSFAAWNRMTQVGKVAWFWRAFNDRTLEALDKLPRDSYQVLRIEDLDYDKYLDVSRFLGYTAKVGAADFDALRESQPHAFWSKRNIDQWTPEEIAEFEGQVGPLAETLRYPYRIESLVEEARAEKEKSISLGRIAKPKGPPRLWRVRRVTADLLRGVAKSVDVS